MKSNKRLRSDRTVWSSVAAVSCEMVSASVTQCPCLYPKTKNKENYCNVSPWKREGAVEQTGDWKPGGMSISAGKSKETGMPPATRPGHRQFLFSSSIIQFRQFPAALHPRELYVLRA